MIELKKLVLQYKDATKDLSEDQFIQLFKQNCKNIKDISQIAYKGVAANDYVDYKLFDSKPANIRKSAHIHSGIIDSFYNIYMSTSQA